MKKTLISILCLAALALWTDPGHAASFVSHPNPFPGAAVTACAESGGWLWIGTEKGIGFRSPGSNSFSVFPDFALPVTSLSSENGAAWAGTRGGLYRLDAAAKTKTFLGAQYPWAGGCIHFMTRDLQGRLWLGCDAGIALLSAPNGTWRSIPLPPDVSGPVRAITPQGTLCYVGAASPALLVLDTDSGRWLQRTPVQNEAAITAITAFGGSIYLGTDGQGLWQYRWADNSWKKLSAGGQLSNTFVMASAAAGQTAWFGTFEGLVQVDQSSGDLRPQPLPELPEGAIAALCLSGTSLYLGLETGLAEWRLDQPNLAFEPERSIILSPQGELLLRGQAYSRSGFRQMTAGFAVQILPQVWFDQNLRIEGPDGQGRITGRWLLEDLPSPSDFYMLRMVLVDRAGNSNTAMAQVIVAPKTPAIAFDGIEGTLNEGLQTITGAFDTPFVADIRVHPGNLKSRPDTNAGKFETTVDLKPGGNNLRAVLTDWFGRQAESGISLQAAANVSPETSVMVKTSETGEETLTLNEVVLFDSGSVKIKRTGFAALEKVANYLNRNEAYNAVVEGHTDNVPIRTSVFPNNLALSKGRAQMVFDFLVFEKGISASRLSLNGLGEGRPIASNQTADGRARNRRVEIVVKKAEGQP